MFSDYFLEVDGDFTLEIEGGFMVYTFPSEEECYIKRVYVAPEKRKSGLGRYMLEKLEYIAKQHGAKFVTGSVRPSSKTATESLQAQFACGFKLFASGQDAIFTKKEL